MRSKRGVDPGQLALWDDPVSSRSTRVRRARRVDLLSFEVTDGAFASRGWHPGTILFYEHSRHRERGHLVVMRCGEQIRVGEYDVVWGRPVLRTDLGSSWISPAWLIDGGGADGRASPDRLHAGSYSEGMKLATAPLVVLGLVGGFAAARYTGRRELGGAVLAGAGAAAARTWPARSAPAPRSA